MNVFVAFTPYQLYVVSLILSQFEWFKEQENVCLNFCGSSYGIEFKRCRVINLKSSNVFRKVVSLLKYKKIARKWKNKDIVLFLSHPLQVIANNLLFSENVKKAYLFEEGVLNYYDARVEGVHAQMMQRNLWLSRFARLKYTTYDGPLAGTDVREFDGVFAFDKSNLVTIPSNNNVYELRAKVEIIDTPGSGVVILDQPLNEIVEPEVEKRVWRELIRYVIDTHEVNIYYKKHPRSLDRFDELRTIFKDIKEITSNEPVELTLRNLNVKFAVSFISSALLNIRSIFPEVKSVSIGANLINEKSSIDFSQLLDLFEMKGVILHDLEEKSVL